MATGARVARTQGERSAESNERLLAAAMQLIAEKGFERTSLAEISRRAGYSHSMVSMRYGSKDALLDELISGGWENRVLKPSPTGQTGLEQILGRIELIIAQIERDPETMRAFCVLFFESAGPFPRLRPRLVEWMGRYERATLRSFRKGRRDRTIALGRKPEDAATQFMTYAIGCCFRWVVEPDYDILKELRAWQRRVAATGNPV